MVRVVLVGGFLGAGKTTIMIRAAHWFEQGGGRAIVITNDQGEALVDSATVEASGVTSGEVTGGCFCCRFDELVDATIELVEEHRAELVLAEAVGSCADLAATVVRPLREYYGDQFQVAPLTVMVEPARWKALLGTGSDGAPKDEGAVSESLVYLYGKQLEEAEIIGLNKMDTVGPDEAERLRQELSAAFPSAYVVPVSAQTGAGAEQVFELWTHWAQDGHLSRPALDMDYDVYAEAEARLAWLNAVFEVAASTPEGYAPTTAVEVLLGELGRRLRDARAFVGHVKAQLSTIDGVTSASLVRAGERPSFRFQQRTTVDRGELVVNARVVAAPALLEHVVEQSVAVMEHAVRARSTVTHWSAFRPARPKPVHRLLA